MNIDIRLNHFIALLINRANCSKSVAEYLKRPSSAPSELSAQSKEENRKLLSETFDIQSDEATPIIKRADLIKHKKERSTSCISDECEYDSDGDHKHIIEHIQRNRYVLLLSSRCGRGDSILDINLYKRKVCWPKI